MMNYFRKILPLFMGLAFILSSDCIIAQSNQHNLVVYGEVLEGEKSDIMIFREVDNDWEIIRTMKSRTLYNLDLNLEHEHYVVFQRKDGLIKALYVGKNTTGKWEMNFNVIFSDFPDKEIKIYKTENKDKYTYINLKRFNEGFEISKEKNIEELITVNN